jgi:hypothetical protein
VPRIKVKKNKGVKGEIGNPLSFFLLLFLTFILSLGISHLGWQPSMRPAPKKSLDVRNP